MNQLLLTPDENCFHRKLHLCVRDDSFVAAWIAREYGRGESIRFRTGDGRGAMSPARSIRCSGYSPSRVRSVIFADGTAAILWSGYLNGRGRLFSARGDAAEELPGNLPDGNWGDFSAAIDNENSIWLAGECWGDREVTIRVFRFDGANWREVVIPVAAAFCCRPTIATAPDGTVLVAWDQYWDRRYQIGSALITGPKAELMEPVAPDQEWCTLPAVTCGEDGSFFLSYCRERLVELPGGHANHHSCIVTSSRAGAGKRWETKGTACIDYAMNPWMAAYVGRRRFSTLVGDHRGGAWMFFEEKLQPEAMNPGPGRLIMCSDRDGKEHIVLEGHSGYVVAGRTLANGKVAVASKTQSRPREQRVPYYLHLCDPQAPLGPRPAGLADNASAASFQTIDYSGQARPSDGPFKLYFGDPHVHSAFSSDLDGEQDKLYHFARDVAKVDFVAFTENDFTAFAEPLPADSWAQNCRNAAFFNRPGTFTTLVGWEYTRHGDPAAGIDLDSHRSVLTNADTVAIHTCFENETPTPADLVKKLPKDGSVILHDHHQFGFDLTDDRLERNIEIVSAWSSWMSESQDFADTICQLLDRGFHIGFIGASDNHERNPGLGGALTGVWARSNSREDIFEAIRSRRCFATTGIRPSLRVRVCGAMMGQEAKASCPPLVHVEVRCSSRRIVKIEIVRDGRVVKTSKHRKHEVTESFEDLSCPPGQHYYYAHVKFAGRQGALPWNQAAAYGVHAWSSPVWIDLEA